MNNLEGRKLHEEIGFVGLRAQATAVGLLQLSIELRRAGILDDDAITRVKAAIAEDLLLTPARHLTRDEHRASVHQRLDRLFSGREMLSEANVASQGALSATQ